MTYLSAELLALQSLRLSETEKRLRWAFFWLCIVFGVGFLLVDLFNDFVWRSDSQWICCGDDWVIATAEEREEFVRKGLGRLFGDQTVLDMLSGRYVLRDTSSGWARYLRFTGYLLECLMLVSLLGSHTVVYLFCEERNLRFPARPDGHMWARKATALVK